MTPREKKAIAMSVKRMVKAIRQGDITAPKRIWAIVSLVLVNGTWKKEISHVWASSKNQALAQYWIGRPKLPRTKICAVGPALGFFVEDKDGHILSAT